jgi:NAD(P)-dependent dehydrogenase (short-subunit alcohol dehydrogenase family)
MNPRFDTYEGLGFTTPISYTCVKASIVSMDKYAAKYMAGKNVRVNVISPSGIFDNQNEIFVERYKTYCLNKGLLNVEDLNGALGFLVSDSSTFINGQNIVIDDGFTLH